MSDKRWMVKGNANGEWIYDPEGNRIFDVTSAVEFDAALKLVRAANAHDGLVKALEKLLKDVRWTSLDHAPDTIEKSEAALRQAKEGE